MVTSAPELNSRKSDSTPSLMKQDAAADLQKKFDAGKVTATPEPGEQPAEQEEG
jgi:hypothetical protein